MWERKHMWEDCCRAEGPFEIYGENFKGGQGASTVVVASPTSYSSKAWSGKLVWGQDVVR